MQLGIINKENLMSKKALFLCSSPRKTSNTNKIVSIVGNIFENNSIDVEIINIANLKNTISGCIDCGACQKSTEFECVFQDATAEIIKRIPEYNYLIFATPIYFMGANAQMKLLLDRMQCLYKFGEKTDNAIKHIKLGLISTAGGSLELGLNLLDDTMKVLSKYTKIPYSSILIPNIKIPSQGLCKPVI